MQENSTGEITMPKVRQSRRPKKKQRTVVSAEIVEIQRFDNVNDNVSYLADRMELVKEKEEEGNFKDDSVAQKQVRRAVKRALNSAPAKSILSEITLDVGGSTIPRLWISCINGR